MCENMHRTCMHVVCMQMYSLFLLRLKKKITVVAGFVFL